MGLVKKLSGILKPSNSSSSLREEEFRLEDYDFDFTNTLKVPESKSKFAQYLASEYNAEPLEFLDALAEYRAAMEELHNQVLNKQKNTELEWKERVNSNSSGSGGFNSSMIKNSRLNLSEYTALHQKFQQLAGNIIDRFLKSGGEKEINVSADSKKFTREAFDKVCSDFEKAVGIVDSLEDDADDSLKTFNQLSLKQQHFHVFTIIEQTLRTEMSMDIFPRFVRSEKFKKWIAKQDVNFIKTITSKRDKGRIQNVLYTYEDWINPIVTDQDFELLRQLKQDSGEWTLEYTHNKGKPAHEQTNLYFRHNQFIVGDNLPVILQKRTLAKIVMYLPFHYNDVMATIMDRNFELESDELMFDSQQIAYAPADPKSGRKYASSACVFRMKFAALLDRRELYVCSSIILDPQDINQYIYICRDMKPMHEKPRGYERSSAYVSYIFQRINDQLTRFTSVYSVNMGGKLAKHGGFANKFVMKKRTKEFREGLMANLTKRQESGWPTITESLGRMDTLEENTKNLVHLYKKAVEKQSDLPFQGYGLEKLKTLFKSNEEANSSSSTQPDEKPIEPQTAKLEEMSESTDITPEEIAV